MAEKVEEMKKYHEVVEIEFTDSMMVMDVDGKRHEFKLVEISELLSKASSEERNNFEVSPSGYGIHWPLIDEDLSIDGLLGIIHSPPDKVASA
jgi:hypothetical protein